MIRFSSVKDVAVCDLESTVANGMLPSSDKVETSVTSVIYSICLYYFFRRRASWGGPSLERVLRLVHVASTRGATGSAGLLVGINSARPRAGAAFWSMVIRCNQLIEPDNQQFGGNIRVQVSFRPHESSAYWTLSAQDIVMQFAIAIALSRRSRMR
jgi:hypothetical protein